MANHDGPEAEPGTPSDRTTPQNAPTSTQEAGIMQSETFGHAEVAAHAASAAGPHPSYHGRTISWIAVGIITAGFVAGGLGLIVGSHGPTWWLFWAGVGIAVIGLLASIATNMFEDWY
jgi:hypothetical protein